MLISLGKYFRQPNNDILISRKTIIQRKKKT